MKFARRSERDLGGLKKLQELKIEVKGKQEENDQTSNDKIFYIKMLYVIKETSRNKVQNFTLTLENGDA